MENALVRTWCRRLTDRPQAAVLVLITAMSCGGCADLARAVSAGDAGVNVESPVAPLALEASHGRYAYPGFEQAPPTPSDVRPATAYRAEVDAKTGQRRELEAWTAAHPAMESDMSAFVAQARRRGLQAGAAPTIDETNAAEAFAARLRVAAAPPPPVP